jgi:hypothetical protein
MARRRLRKKIARLIEPSLQHQLDEKESSDREEDDGGNDEDLPSVELRVVEFVESSDEEEEEDDDGDDDDPPTLLLPGGSSSDGEESIVNAEDAEAFRQYLAPYFSESSDEEDDEWVPQKQIASKKGGVKKCDVPKRQAAAEASDEKKDEGMAQSKAAGRKSIDRKSNDLSTDSLPEQGKGQKRAKRDSTDPGSLMVEGRPPPFCWPAQKTGGNNHVRAAIDQHFVYDKTLEGWKRSAWEQYDGQFLVFEYPHPQAKKFTNEEIKKQGGSWSEKRFSRLTAVMVVECHIGKQAYLTYGLHSVSHRMIRQALTQG